MLTKADLTDCLSLEMQRDKLLTVEVVLGTNGVWAKVEQLELRHTETVSCRTLGTRHMGGSICKYLSHEIVRASRANAAGCGIRV